MIRMITMTNYDDDDYNYDYNYDDDYYDDYDDDYDDDADDNDPDNDNYNGNNNNVGLPVCKSTEAVISSINTTSGLCNKILARHNNCFSPVLNVS